jgi:serine/threonine protein kinase/class 3 adenylate cyclase
LASFVQSDHCRRILEIGERFEPPYLALQWLAGTSLSDLLQARAVSLPELRSLSQVLIEVSLACHTVGLAWGGLTGQSVFWLDEGRWLVEVTGLRSPRFERDDSLENLYLAPELRGREKEATLFEYDPAANVYSVGGLLREVIQRCSLRETEFGAQVWEWSSACLASDPGQRPWLDQLTDIASAITEASQAGPVDHSQAATVDVDIDLLPSHRHLEIGSRLGRFELHAKLGEGAMGVVYRSVDPADGLPVAIKVIHRQVASDSVAARRFAKEAKLLSLANSPYVANLREVNTENAIPYMVIELVAGGSLASRLESGRPLDERWALALLTDTLRGLSIAHARGIVHRDFKPENVLLTEAALAWLAQEAASSSDSAGAPPVGPIYAKVSDFGLARAAQQSESMAVTRQGVLLGTPLYMSPEQCRGEPATESSDVYSVGVTLYQLLSGRPPFESDSQIGLIQQHCQAMPPSLKQLRPQLPDVLVRIVEKCLAKNPDARYANAESLLVDLENYLRGAPTSLVLHPAVLLRDDPGAVRFEHHWDLASSPEQLWPYVSHTDRVNHAMGLPAVAYSIRQDKDGPKRFAETSIAGQKVRWLEHPYEWIEGKRLSVLREFTAGPLLWFVNIVQLQATPGGGTRLTQTLIAKPKNWLGRQLARWQLGKKARAGFGRVYQQIDQYLVQTQSTRGDRNPFATKTKIASGQRHKLLSRIQSLREHALDPSVLSILEQYLEHASDLDVARMRPIALAERFGQDASQWINACLLGVRAGVLDLLWDIICPTCRIPANIQQTLTAIQSHGYCEACNMRFDVDLLESVELVFRAHREIRDVDTQTYCIGGPAWSRHVVAQVRLAPGERFACELELVEGAYTVRGPQMPFTVDFRTSHASAQHATGLKRLELSLARPPDSRSPIRLRPFSQVIHLCNDTTQDQQVRIERLANRHDALTAAKASTMALFRELFPGEVLAGDQIVSIAHLTLLRVKLLCARWLYESMGDGPAFGHVRRHLEHMLRVVQDNDGAIVKIIGEGILASFARPLQAVQAAVQLVSQPLASDPLPMAAAASAGSTMVATINDRLDYFGGMVQDLETSLESATAPAVILTSAILDRNEVHDWSSDQGMNWKVARATGGLGPILHTWQPE